MSSSRISRSLLVGAAIAINFFLLLWHTSAGLPQNAAPPSVTETWLEALPPRPSFYDIAAKHGTDKVLLHHYEQLYEHRLAPLRDQRIKMLEIGLGCDMSYGPGASYYTWLEYFSNVDLYYIEYDADCAAKWANYTGDATIFAGDQADEAFLQKFLAESGGNFDIIVDDGGHTMTQQRVSLKVLWDSVKPGGMYIVEDLNTSYMEGYGGGPAATDTFMEDIRDLLHHINKQKDDPKKSKIAQSIVSLELTQECVCLTKRPAGQQRY